MHFSVDLNDSKRREEAFVTETCWSKKCATNILKAWMNQSKELPQK